MNLSDKRTDRALTVIRGLEVLLMLYELITYKSKVAGFVEGCEHARRSREAFERCEFETTEDRSV